MAKSNIIKQLVNNEISLEVTLNRLKVIVYGLKNSEINQWIENELCSYSKDSQIPEYRIDRAGGRILYSGFNGSFQVAKLPLPESFISKEYREKIQDSQIHLSVRSLEEVQKSGDGLSRDLTYLAGDVEDNSGISCTSIWQVYDSTIIDRILSNIKSKLLGILLMLEEAYGVLDELDIDTSKANKDMNRETSANILQIIFNDNGIKIGDGNKLNKSSIFNRGKRNGDKNR